MITRSKSKAMPVIRSPAAKATESPVTQAAAGGSVSAVQVPDVESAQARSTRSSRCSATTAGRKASAAASHMRRQLEREQELAERERVRDRKLAEMQREVEEKELEAELASIDAASSKGSGQNSVSNRTNQWVSDVNSRGIFVAGCDHIPVAPISRQETQNPPPTTYAAPQISRPCLPQKEPFVSTANSDALWQAVADTAAAAKAIATNQNKVIKSELFPFFGNALQWLQFKSIYNCTKIAFSPLDNLLRLQNALRGPARDAVAPLLVAGEDPEQIMRALEETFARPEMIVYREVAALKNLPKLGYDLKELPIICNRVRNSVSTIKLLKQTEYLCSPELFHAILGKLNPFIKLRWTDFAMRDCSQRPKLEILADFLKCELDQHIRFGLSPDAAFQAGSTSQCSSFDNNKHKHFKNENIHVTDTDVQTNNPSKAKQVECIYCKKNHNIKSCSDFKVLTVEDRWRWLKESKVCFRCMKANRHSWKACKVPVCGENGCLQRHHPLLHRQNTVQRSATTSNTYTTDTTETAEPILVKDIEQSDTANTYTTEMCESTRALLKIVPVTVTGPAGSRDIFALLDDGSTATIIESSVAAAIGATGPSQTITVNGIGGLSMVKTISFVDINIKGRNTPDTFLIKNVRTMTGLQLGLQTVSRESIASCTHLADLVDTLTYQDATPSMLIGTEHWYLSISHETRTGKRKQPAACRTALGWVLYGVASSRTKPVEFVNHATLTNRFASQDIDLDLLIKEHYELEAIGVSKLETVHSKQDLRTIEILNVTTKRLSSGRFEVGLPWRDDILNVPDSFPQAYSRFNNLERRMRQNLEFGKAYSGFVGNMLDKDYAEECPADSYHDKMKVVDGIRFYLPHFGVFHPQKRKLRVVLDAAAKTDGVSLNSLLLPGPDLLRCLLGILFRFREGRIAMSADIREMFSQIKVRQEDRDALRFLWRASNEQPIKEYRMSSVIFGASCSPFIAQHVKNLNGKQHEHKYPKATEAILSDHYMDDYVGSVDSKAEAAQLAADIVTVHGAACMEMRGWVSNDQAALELISPDLRAQKSLDIDTSDSNSSCVKVLGIKWSPDSDCLGFRSAGNTLPSTLTKRAVLSQLMRVFDPLGLLAPIIIKGRILFQQIWRSCKDWDAPLSSSNRQKWVDWFGEVSEAASLKIPRWYANAENCEPFERELHVFADSSEYAFACVAFWRLLYENGTVRVELISSKARVAPIKPISIPRLELQAALIASRLAVTIRDSHRNKPVRTYLWTDSMIVLGWLRSEARTFKVFVAHRIGEILENTFVDDWRWVPTALNVADEATRARSIQLNIEHRWFRGPSFLQKSIHEWPSMPAVVPQAREELKQQPRELVAATSVVVLPCPVTACFERFSSWTRLVRATARAHQAAASFGKLLAKHTQNSKSISRRDFTCNRSLSTSPTLPPLHVSFVNAAEKHILQRLQLESFSEDFDCLLNSRHVDRRSKLAKLSPILGPDQLICLAGRIEAVQDVDPNTRCPILLDGRHPTVRLLVLHYHVKAGHANHHTVINEIRQRFWLIGLRNAVRTTANKCLICKIRKARTMTPAIGNLPPQRLAHHRRPFTFTGLDYFGPLTVTIGRRHEKRYVALFTCLTIRAVHLELVHSLSADSAIMALRRFFARRGIPDTIFSDNGTAFVGANRILKEFYADEVRDFAATRHVNWSFIPPAAPTFGGCWERLVRSVKVALTATLRERAPRDETLRTLLAEAEAIVNSRPLGHVSSDPDCPTSLTPFHFLIGTASNEAMPRLDEGTLVGRADFKKALRLAELFWNRWVREILPDMQPRAPISKETNVKIGDVVIIADESLPRGTWPKGRITKVYPGRDGVVRVADVATLSGILRRPLRKLVMVPTQGNF